MHRRGRLTVLFLVATFLLAGLLTGCGGEDQSGNGSQDGKSEQQGNAASNENARPETQTVEGKIKKVKPDKGKFTLVPTAAEEGAEPLIFKLARQPSITVGGQEAAAADLRSGQVAEVEYTVVNDVNKVRSVTVGDTPS